MSTSWTVTSMRATRRFHAQAGFVWPNFGNPTYLSGGTLLANFVGAGVACETHQNYC